MKTIQLTNGKTCEIKRLGALSQARALGIISELIGDERVQRGYAEIEQRGAALVSQESMQLLGGVLQSLLIDHIGAVTELILLASSLENKDLEVDGDDAIGLQDIAAILTAAWEENGMSRMMEKLGNAPKPPAMGGADRKAEKKAPRR
ncbi:MAG: hypothetical protein AB1656_05110 [Candidatus Omnitrophota bacterium]